MKKYQFIMIFSVLFNYYLLNIYYNLGQEMIQISSKTAFILYCFSLISFLLILLFYLVKFFIF